MTLFVRTRRKDTPKDPNTLFVPHPTKGADMCQPHRKVETNKVVVQSYSRKVTPASSTGTNKESPRDPRNRNEKEQGTARFSMQAVHPNRSSKYLFLLWRYQPVHHQHQQGHTMTNGAPFPMAARPSSEASEIFHPRR